MLFISVVCENETAITMTQTSSIETMLQHLVIRLFATFGFLSQTTHRFSGPSVIYSKIPDNN